jgi:hypothetical protein
MGRKINFEYQTFDGLKIVALDASLSDFKAQPVRGENGKLEMRIAEKTVKDCRYIDGCIYYHLGRVSDSVMVDLIEKFQKLLKEKGWKPVDGIKAVK